MPIDWANALARAEELKDLGYDDHQVSAVLDQEAAAADRAAQAYGHENAQAARSTLQSTRGALNAEAAPPGQQPAEDPIARGFALAEESGHQRGSELRMQTYVDSIWEAAQAGDPRVSAPHSAIDDATRRRWLEDAHKRQIANRNASGAEHR